MRLVASMLLSAGQLVQVRDISTNQAWQDAMHLSVPVLVALDSQQQEVSLSGTGSDLLAEKCGCGLVSVC